MATTLQPITIAEMDAAQYPKRSRIDRLRSELMQRDGQDERVVARQIRCRLDSLPGASCPDLPAAARTGHLPPAGGVSGRVLLPDSYPVLSHFSHWFGRVKQ